MLGGGGGEEEEEGVGPGARGGQTRSGERVAATPRRRGGAAGLGKAGAAGGPGAPVTWAGAAGKAAGALLSFLEEILIKVKVPDRMFLEDHLGFPPYHPPHPRRTHFSNLPGWTALGADRLPRSHLQFPHGLD